MSFPTQQTQFEDADQVPTARTTNESGGADVRTFDVLSTRTKAGFQHPGNIYFRQLVRTYRPRYQDSSSGRQIKLAVVAEIVRRVSQAGGRFLKKTAGDSWRKLNEQESYGKVGHALRSAKATQTPYDALILRLHIPADGSPPSVVPSCTSQVQPFSPMCSPQQQRQIPAVHSFSSLPHAGSADTGSRSFGSSPAEKHILSQLIIPRRFPAKNKQRYRI